MKTVEVFLRVLGATSVRYALLDGSAHGWRQPESDLDLVSSEPLDRLLPAITPTLVRAGVYPLMTVCYDVDRGDTVWLVGAEDDVIQVDVLSDPRGINRLAFSTDTALESIRTPEDGIPRVGREVEMAYRVVKNVSRRRFERLQGPDLSGLDRSELTAALKGIYGENGQLAMATLGRGDWAAVRGQLQRSLLLTRISRGGPGVLVSVARRLLNRMYRPVGLWLHFHGSAGWQAADLTWSALSDGFARRQRQDWDDAGPGRISAQAMIRRPSLLVTWGRRRRPRSALVVEVGDVPPPWQDLRTVVLSRAAARAVEGSR